MPFIDDCLWLLLRQFFLSSACSPLVNFPGKPVMQPKLANDHFSAADGTILPVRSWLPKSTPVKAIVVALHGFNDYSNSFVSTGKFLSLQGIACYAYDQRGFGLAPERGVWSGVAAYTDDLAAFVREVRKLYRVWLYLWARHGRCRYYCCCYR
jgi:alpha-beta hydrolase superfamily lysophospholipase